MNSGKIIVANPCRDKPNYEHCPLAKFIIGFFILLFKNIDYF